MGELKFRCPETYNKVSTGIDIDPDSFASLSPTITHVDCPYCEHPHVLAAVHAWIEGEEQVACFGSPPPSFRRNARIE